MKGQVVGDPDPSVEKTPATDLPRVTRERDDAAGDRFALLEARHVEALTGAVRALNTTVTKLVLLAEKQLPATQQLNKGVSELADLLRPRDPKDVVAEHTPGGTKKPKRGS